MTEEAYIAVLNVAEGDMKLTFDPSKPAEVEFGARVVTEMLQRGYALVVQVGTKDGEPVFRRVTRFDPETNEYIVKDAPSAPNASASVTPPKRRGRRNLRVPASGTGGVSVARSAGGCARQ